MILSDHTIREELKAGRIVIEPLDERDIQPSSVDLHIDRYFRVFRNHSMRVIDVKQDQEELTELVEIGDDDSFILHPGEFVLGSTAERVVLPNDLVARLEGKSSLGRLGLLIHSSLPGSEPVVILSDGALTTRPIEDVVRKRINGSVVGFDPETFEVGYFPITGWYQGPPDRIFEVRLASGRSVRVTAGHNLFSLDCSGNLKKTRTADLVPGSRVAIPRRIGDPPLPRPSIDVLSLMPEPELSDYVVEGPAIAGAYRDTALAQALREAGFGHVDHYRARAAAPLHVVRRLPELAGRIGPHERVRAARGRNGIPAVIEVDAELAWLLGLYVAEGYRRRGQAVISNTDALILDRAESALARLGLPVYRAEGVALTCSSIVFSSLLSWLGIGDGAINKRMPVGILGWPRDLLRSFLEGMLDGDGSRDPQRYSYWTSSSALVADVLLLSERLCVRAAAWQRNRGGSGLYQVAMPLREHKLLTSVPMPDRLLVELREQCGLSQRALASAAGFRNPSDLNNIERRSGRDALRLATLRRLRRALEDAPAGSPMPKLDRLVDGHLAWDKVLEVRDTGDVEQIYDLEVRPDGRRIENFLAGSGGVFVSNTAGFVDAGWDGHLTLELSNVANLPITLYPGMKIGQISFLRMTTPADNPYGSDTVGSKYQGQRGPTPSRYFENFR